MFVLTFLTIGNYALAAEPKCQTQNFANHTAKLCVTSQSFKHDYYSLLVDNDLIFTLADDFVEQVSLTHTIAPDAAIGFAASKQGMPTVAIEGGCRPISEKSGNEPDAMMVEVARICSFKLGNEQIIKEVRFTF